MALIVGAAFLAAGAINPGLAPFVLAALVSGLTIAVWNEGSAQIWWVSLLGSRYCSVRLRPQGPVPDEPSCRKGDERTDAASAFVTVRTFSPNCAAKKA